MVLTGGCIEEKLLAKIIAVCLRRPLSTPALCAPVVFYLPLFQGAAWICLVKTCLVFGLRKAMFAFQTGLCSKRKLKYLRSQNIIVANQQASHEIAILQAVYFIKH